MGYSLCWLAVKTTDHQALFEQAQVRPTDEPDEVFESPIAGTALKDGWFLLVAQGADHRILDEKLLRSLSAKWTCVACGVEEHVMLSFCVVWNGGNELWSVSHDAQKDLFDLTAVGTPPASFAKLRDDAVRQQQSEGGADAGVDHLFDVPLQLAKELTGFRHDEEPPLDQPVPLAFTDEGRKRRWWQL